VIDLVLELRARAAVYPLLGNHEALLLDCLDDPSPLHVGRFVYNGGGATLQSYSQQPGDYKIPGPHVDFLRSLRLAYQSDAHLFVHAGLPDLPVKELREDEHRETMLWVRETFHRSTFRWGKVVVHGHSRVDDVEVGPARINVDTGCVYENKLSAIHLPSGQVYQVLKRGTVEHGYLREPAASRRKAVRFEGHVDVALSEPRGLPMFTTLNYNDFGLLLVSTRNPEMEVLSVGQHVTGTIFPNDSHVRVSFRGAVVRVENWGVAFRYGIRFDAPAVQPP